MPSVACALSTSMCAHGPVWLDSLSSMCIVHVGIHGGLCAFFLSPPLSPPPHTPLSPPLPFSSFPPSPPPHSFWDRVSSMILEFTDCLDWLTSNLRDLSISHLAPPTPPQTQGLQTPEAAFCVQGRKLNSVLLASTASILPTEPSSQPQIPCSPNSSILMAFVKLVVIYLDSTHPRRKG